MSSLGIFLLRFTLCIYSYVYSIFFNKMVKKQSIKFFLSSFRDGTVTLSNGMMKTVYLKKDSQGRGGIEEGFIYPPNKIQEERNIYRNIPKGIVGGGEVENSGGWGGGEQGGGVEWGWLYTHIEGLLTSYPITLHTLQGYTQAGIAHFG